MKQIDLSSLQHPEPDPLEIDISDRFSGSSLNDIGLMAARDGQHARAIIYFRKAIYKSPEYAFIYSNYALSLRDLGYFADAIKLLEHARILDNANPILVFNLANLLYETGQLRPAMANYDQAVRLNGSFPDLFCNYALAALEAQEYGLALRMAQRGLTLTNADSPFYLRFIVILASLDAIMGDTAAGLARLEDVMASRDASDVLIEYVRLLAIAAPSDLSERSLSFIRQALEEQWSAPEQFIHSAWIRLVEAYGLPQVASDPNWPRLADLLLASALVPDLKTEAWLIQQRQALFQRASDESLNGREIEFYRAIAQQCFLRNYLFEIDDLEHKMRPAWLAKIATLLDESITPTPLLLLQIACSTGLSEVSGAHRLLSLADLHPAILPVLRQQVENPLLEGAIEPTIPRLMGERAKDLVADRYRKYPYPQWTWPGRLHRPERFNIYLSQRLGHSNFSPLAAASVVRILVAGCGTGRHSHFLARTVSDGAIKALDISRPSLAFAKRQALADGVETIEYIEGDITQLESWDERFDVIECAGVLHHLPDPDAGLRILLQLLRPRGLIMLGLYSRRGRSALSLLRERVPDLSQEPLDCALHKVRRLVINDPDLRSILSFREFYGFNECIDLLLHPREVDYTPIDIALMLAGHGLIFRGFELSAAQRNLFRMRNRGANDLFDLKIWDSHEQEHPDTFASMYHFWAQKKE
jgi:2-polyprenyl-3-methyl-5-hydroxy-6-metoxy-1,4-benzoquinol methylase